MATLEHTAHTEPFDATVLQVIPALDEGGAERTTVEIARAVIARGGRALVASRGGRMVADLENAGAGFAPLPVHSKNPLAIAANAVRLARLIRRERVDVVDVRSRAPAWSALAASRMTGVPLVTTYHGAYRDGGALKRFYNSAMVRGALVIANSRFTAETIRRNHPKIDPNRVMTVPRGADLTAFDPNAVSAERVRRLAEQWDIGLPDAVGAEGPAILLMPARFTDWKGHRVAVAALAALRSMRTQGRLEFASAPADNAFIGRDLRLIFCGDTSVRSDFASALRQLSVDLGVSELVMFAGHCSDMPAAYALADIVLSPATSPEAFGRVAVEAGAMAKPVIASALGGARETVVDAETGILVPPADPTALAAAIVSLLDRTPAARAAMGVRARARIVREYSVDAMCDATLSAYRRAMDRHGPARREARA